MNFGHLLIVGREPKGAARIVFDISRQFLGELLPKGPRIEGERELGLGIVHHNDVTHAGCGGAARDGSAIQNKNLQSSARALRSASSSDDSCAHNNEIEGLSHGRNASLTLSILAD